MEKEQHGALGTAVLTATVVGGTLPPATASAEEILDFLDLGVLDGRQLSYG